MAQLSFQLAKAFGWSPDVIRKLTMAEAQTYVDMLIREESNE